MNKRPILDPRMLERLSGFFPTTIDILSTTNAPDSMGSPVDDFTIVYEGIPAAIAPIHDLIPIAGEMKTATLNYNTDTRHVTLKGYYPNITEKMVMVADAETYNILGVEHDMFLVLTRLVVELVTI